jgi:hypothetical protein
MLACKEESADYYKIAFANQALLDDLNKVPARGGQGPACSWIEDKAKIKCLRTDNLETRIAANPELSRPPCNPDPNYDGSDFSCFLVPYDLKSSPQQQTTSIAPSLPALAAPPNPCRYEATYYEPQAPIVETSSPNVEVGDQLQIRCEFAKKTRRLEWQQCNDDALTAIQILKSGEESGGRYSGLFVVDGATIGVASSPLDRSDFDSTGLWTFNESGVHKIACMIDNGLRPAEKDGAVYLEAGVELTVQGAADAQQFRIFNPEAARRLPTQASPEESGRRREKP